MHPSTARAWTLASLTALAASCSSPPAVQCPANQAICGDQCADLSGDPGNCGACGNVCDLGQQCVGGACGCQSGTACSDGCADLQNDPFNCGACGNRCDSTMACSGGACSATCPGSTTMCAQRCVDLQTDPGYCGSCTRSCGLGERCSGGACHSPCQSPLTACGSTCVNRLTDPANCGQCGVVCAAGSVCSSGQCRSSCDSGLTACGSSCVDVATDAANCGGCGRACASGETCASGACHAANVVGPTGGSVDLLKFGIVGDTRPPNCDQTTSYPTAIITGIVDQMAQKNVQFGLDLGDHMYVCNGGQSAANTQMGYYMQAIARLSRTFFMTQGNHECSSTPCLPGSTNPNHVVFMNALAPISSSPYYSFNVQTSLGLATFVVIADNSWSTTQQTWLDQTLATADTAARYTIVVRHHPQADTSVADNSANMAIIRKHKFSLMLAGHSHLYRHETVDGGRDIVLGTGGAPLSGSFYGYAIIEQLASGKLQVSVYDMSSQAPVDVWSVGPN